MSKELSQIEEFRQQRHQFLIEELNKFEIAFLLFQNEYKPQNSNQPIPFDTISIDKENRVIQIKSFIDQTKNLLLQEDSLAFQTAGSIQKMLEYMETRLACLKKLYQVKHQIHNGNGDVKKGKRFSKKANLILIQWLCEHFEYPYPSLEEQISLSQKCQLTFKQVQSWFINSRGKIVQKVYNEKKFKNLVKEKYLSQFKN